ncbi:hypothetical protein N7530_012803, partial [Penicillium desertorum]
PIKANPYPEVTDPFCRLPLSTLFYQLGLFTLETCYGCGQPGVKTIPPADFQGSSGAHRTPQKCSALPAIEILSSGQTNFGVIGCREKKRTLPRTPANISAFSYVAVENPHLGAGMLTGFPLRHTAHEGAFKRNFLSLGSTNPCANCCSASPRFGPQSSHLDICCTTKICAGRRPRSLNWSRTTTPAYSFRHRFYPDGGIDSTLKRHPVQASSFGRKLLHTLADSDFHGHHRAV